MTLIRDRWIDNAIYHDNLHVHRLLEYVFAFIKGEIQIN